MPATNTDALTETRDVVAAPEAVRLHAFAVASLAAASCRRVIISGRNGGDPTPTEWPLEPTVSLDADGVLHVHVKQNAVHTEAISCEVANAAYRAIQAALTEAGISHKRRSWPSKVPGKRSYWFATGDWYMGSFWKDGRRAEIRITG